MRSARSTRVMAMLALLALPAAAEVNDPMRPPGYSAAAGTLQPATARQKPPRVDWQLQSTLIAGDRRSAILNGLVVTPGASVLGARVVGIDRDSVTLLEQGHKVRIRADNPVVRIHRPGGDS